MQCVVVLRRFPIHTDIVLSVIKFTEIILQYSQCFSTNPKHNDWIVSSEAHNKAMIIAVFFCSTVLFNIGFKTKIVKKSEFKSFSTMWTWLSSVVVNFNRKLL